MSEEIRSILNPRKTAGFYLNSNWIFTSYIEKLGLAIVIGLAVWKVWEFFI